jgi:predicted ferric reductase
MNKIKQNTGLIVLVILTLLPILFWLLIMPLNRRFLNAPVALTSVGQILGLVGMALFSLNLILSARLKFLEDNFNGLNKIYINHHLIGGICLILLLFHPLFLVAKYIPISLQAAAMFFLPTTDITIGYGIFALLGMIIVLGITFYAKLPYHIWKLTHKFMGLVYIFAALHIFFVSSDIASNMPLRLYMLGLLSLAFLGIFYRTVLGIFLVKKYRYIVRSANMLNSKVMELELAAIKQAMSYLPGQFVFVSFGQHGLSREWHPFTISSGPAATNLKLTIKSLGDYTKDLMGLKAGATALIEGPFGKFTFLEGNKKSQIWVAGGIGITPFLSMVRDLANHPEYDITLFYSTKNSEEAVYLNELGEIAKTIPRLKVVSHYSDAQGKITAEIIKKRIGGFANKNIFICGPVSMMKNLKNQFILLNVPDENIYSEEFAL